MGRRGIRVWQALAVGGAAMFLSNACMLSVDAGQYLTREEKRFQVSGAPQVSLTTFDGSVEVRAWDRSEVLVEIEKRASDKARAEAIEVKAVQSGNAITIEVVRPDGTQAVFGLHSSPSARIVASVPRQCQLVARTGDGSVTVERVSGKIDLDTEDGSIRGFDLAGTMRAHTRDGSLRFDDVDGAVDLDTGDGSARLSGRLTGVRLRTGDGSVEVRAEKGSVMSDDWDLRTGDGSLRVELPDEFAADLDASTGDGSVRVHGFGEPTVGGRDEESRRDLRRPLGGGGRHLRLRSDSGSITVRAL